MLAGLLGMGDAAMLLFGIMGVGSAGWLGYEVWIWRQKRRKREQGLRALEKVMKFGERYGVGANAGQMIARNEKAYFGSDEMKWEHRPGREIDRTMARIEDEVSWRRQWGL